MFKRLFFIGTIFALWSGSVAHAAPLFCLAKEGVYPQCSYYNMEECTVRAQAVGGYCELRKGDDVIALGKKDFCTIYDGVRIECLFDTMEDCRRNIPSDRTQCIKNAE